MSLVDRTNETIPLSQHGPMTSPDWSGLPGWDGYSVPTGTDTSTVTATKLTPAELDVDADGDSSYDPDAWVNICWTDDKHDSDCIKLTYDEAALLHDRLGRILGLVAGADNADLIVKAKHKAWFHRTDPEGDADVADLLDRLAVALGAAREQEEAE